MQLVTLWMNQLKQSSTIVSSFWHLAGLLLYHASGSDKTMNFNIQTIRSTALNKLEIETNIN